MITEDKVTEIFCIIDGFCKFFEQENGKNKTTLFILILTRTGVIPTEKPMGNALLLIGFSCVLNSKTKSQSSK